MQTTKRKRYQETRFSTWENIGGFMCVILELNSEYCVSWASILPFRPSPPFIKKKKNNRRKVKKKKKILWGWRGTGGISTTLHIMFPVLSLRSLKAVPQHPVSTLRPRLGLLNSSLHWGCWGRRVIPELRKGRYKNEVGVCCPRKNHNHSSKRNSKQV